MTSKMAAITGCGITWVLLRYSTQKNNRLLFYPNGNVFVFVLVIVSINPVFAGSDNNIISYYSHISSYFGKVFCPNMQ